MLPIQASTLDPNSPWGTLIKVHVLTIHFTIKDPNMMTPLSELGSRC